MNFEWDDNKARVNLSKHRISFDLSRLVFDDPNKVDDIDDNLDFGEERWIATGLAGNQLLVVVYVLRREKIRIISARRATKYEEQDYYQQT